jgi:predicted signal transduction protein with EAL and GGDEF domain
MEKLRLYRVISSLLKIKYRNKLILLILAGMYLPRIVLFFVVRHAFTTSGALHSTVVATTVVVTFMGAFLVLTFVDSLLQPIYLTARSLKDYAQNGTLPQMPTNFPDEAGTLMAETQKALVQLDANLRHLTDFDQVTALPTRQTFTRILAADLTADSRIAICALGVSNYDKIAAAFGQHSVNSVIVSIAAHIRELLGHQVPLSHLGSHTFLFVLDLDESKPKLATRIETIRLEVEKKIILPGVDLHPEMEAGVSLYTGGPLDAERLINEAVSAMSGIHNESDTHTNFFSPKQNAHARDILLIERDLRIAIDQEQFSINYQPIVDTLIGKVVGAEALVRWTHPGRGMVSPALFIPIAEKCGLMDAIGMRVLQQVCAQLGHWSGTPLSNVKVSINLSARQFLNPQAVSQIREALIVNGVSPRNLEIELTETTVIQDTQRTLLILQELRRIGITIAIDDFGTGYSGLSYLKTLPFDRLKIDREFIQDVDQAATSQAICKSLIQLASGLGIEVLAEGTETAAEVAIMRSLGCGLFQGYHFARPVSADKFADAVHVIEASLSRQNLNQHHHEAALSAAVA